ncbi:unnamed protein product [Ambrosiozyma monospora]|uniref:Unnamed protein product n=1 Tax=Ambrosiozyma monospora TaxID=43982 RepID=A0ACB5T1X6_AMBMO|nr:unnamed protein product [Ambrosiozyma monospora]
MTDLEVYLSHCISQISSSDYTQVQDGFQLIESLFGKLCILANPNKSITQKKRPSSNVSQHSQFSSVSTSTVSSDDFSPSSVSSSGIRKWRVPSLKDTVFGEYISLQNRFDYNIVNTILLVLLRAQHTRDHPTDTMTSCLKVLQGCLLLHPKSRDLFQRELNMTILIDFLKPSAPVQLLANLIPALVSVLVRNVGNLRMFEKLEGPKRMCLLLTHKPKQNVNPQSWKEVQVKVLEFLFFYLIPETQKPQGSNSATVAKSSGSGIDVGASGSGSSDTNLDKSSSAVYADGHVRRTMQDKRKILNQYLNVDITEGLINELLESKPFGNMNTEW